MYLLECTRIREGLHKKTQAAAGKQRWEYFLWHFKSVVSYLKLSVTMVTGTSDQGRGARVKQAGVTPLRHFCVSGIIIFFVQYHMEIFVAITLKWALFVTNIKDIGITGSVYQTR